MSTTQPPARLAAAVSRDRSLPSHAPTGSRVDAGEGPALTRVAGALFLFLVTVMIGGAALLRFLTTGDVLTDWQADQFRAGHAHGGVLLILALVYVVFLERTRWSPARRRIALATLIIGGVGQSGGFFLHMLTGEPESFSAGIALTLGGAVLLATAVIALGVSLLREVREDEPWTV